MNRAPTGDPVADMIPDPETAAYVGGGTPEQFRFVGIYNVERMRDLGGLRPNDRVLDIGCGIGRVAIAMTQYLDSRGTYVGFDIVKRGIDWCQERITPRYPNFTFFLADIHNDLYHPEGRQAAGEYRFPFDDGSFDFVFLTSVFTHMPRREVEHYIDEISRVLVNGGRCFCTAFVITGEARRRVEQGTSGRPFVRTGDGYWIERTDSPMAAVAYDDTVLEAAFNTRGFELVKFAPDAWYDNPWAQDTVVLRKVVA
ncbi:MAG TPA: class I SAM-dependent methyltransferase [Usitatibacter sp.]|nr:class I SAM-dependent methyltransferase [Usitatibacter sp.]